MVRQTGSEGVSRANSILYLHAETRMLNGLGVRNQHASAVRSRNANQPQVEFRQKPFGKYLLASIAQR
jgi:hypothetical protein